MIKLLEMAKFFLTKADIPSDGVLADFTMGNGHDTLYLCRLVPMGMVYSFDIQKEAVENTAKLLKEEGISNAKLIYDSHAELEKYIPGKINAGMFNLGYRPGGDKKIHTMKESTIKAITAAIKKLVPGGILVVSVYPGHEEGRLEGQLIEETLCDYDKKDYSIVEYKLINSPDSPFIIAVQANSSYKEKD
ncbi:MAG: class I SAM-dependent methyltransferase [Bacillota bacterium]|nr:class I SAM-dependent methyltransferase [Bacillota bacterium]